MSIEIFNGLESDDTALALLEDAKNKAEDASHRLFFIVPNHAKFSAEVNLLERYAKLLKQDNLFATNQLQVFSFSRFNWYLTKNFNLGNDFRVNRTGLFILVNRIIDEHFDELQAFKTVRNSSGFIEKIVDQLQEIRSSQMTVTQLLEEVDDIPENQRLIEKLVDLEIIEKYLHSTINNQFSLETDALIDFYQQLDQINLHNTTIYLNGFSDFTNLELSIVEKLAEKTDVKIALTSSNVKGDLFEITHRLINQLKQFAEEQNIDFQITSVTNKKNISKKQLNLENNFLNQFNNEEHDLDQNDVMNLVSASDPLAELNYVAGKIRQLINRHPDINLSDILVVARSLDPYKNYLQSVFNTHQIPTFVDLDQTMNQHPLSEFLLIMLKQLNDNNFYQNTNSLLRLLKTQLLVDDSIDDFSYVVSKFENYLIEFAPANSAFVDGFAFKTDDYSDEDLKLINQLRDFIVKAISDFNNQLENANDNQEAAIALIKWIYRYKIDQRIIEISNQFSDNPQLSQRQLQIWNNVNTTLEQIVILSGSDRFDSKKFSDALSIGFNGSNFARIPTTLNQLTISEAGAAQSDNYKYIFYIGATRDALPQYSKNKLIINDEDREILEEIFKNDNYMYRLKETANQLAANEPYYFYKALLSATEEVFISYVENADSKPSNYLLRLKQSDNQVTVVSNYLQKPSELVSHIGSPRYLINQISHLNRLGITLTNFENNILDSEDRILFENILSSRNYQNLGANVDSETIKELFNQQFNFSISQLEMYNKNPYEYFLAYILSIKERKKFEFSSTTAGNFSHQLLDQLFSKMIENETSLADINLDDLQTSFYQISEDLKTEDQYKNLLSSIKNQAILDDQIQNIWNNLMVMQQLSQKFSTKTINTESSFSDLKLSDAVDFNLRGRIDRIDQINIANQSDNIVFDYKSKASGKEFDLLDFWYGIELQLMTYWMSLEKSDKKNSTSGAFFVKIIDKPIGYSDLSADEKQIFNSFFGENPNKPNQYLQKHQFSGLISQSIEENFNVKTKTVLKQDELKSVKQHHLSNINQTANNIIEGHFPIAPYRIGNNNGMMYSPFKTIINFDRTLGDKYNDITDTRKNIRNKLGEDDD